MDQRMNCEDCFFWTYKDGCKKFLNPPKDYKLCAFFKDSRMRDSEKGGLQSGV